MPTVHLFGSHFRIVSVMAWLLVAAVIAAPPEPPADPVAAETERNAAYARQLDETKELVATTDAEIHRLDRESDEVNKLVDGARRRIELGRVETIGPSFLRELVRIRETREMVRDTAAQRSTVDLDVRRLDLADRLEELQDITAAVERALVARADLDPATRAGLAARLASVLSEQRDDRLIPLIAANQEAIDALTRLAAARKTLVTKVASYQDFILGNLLWLRANDATGPIEFVEGVASGGRLAAGADWSAAARHVSGRIAAHPMPWLAAAAAFLGLLALRGTCRRALERTAVPVSRAASDRFACTLEATAATVGLALPFPLLAWFLSRRLMADQGDDLLAASVGSALYRAFPLIVLVSSTLALTRAGGLAAAHFRWPERSLASMRRASRWLLYVVLPLSMTVSILVLGIDPSERGASAGQALSILAAAGWTIIMARTAHPTSGIFAETLARHPGRLAARTRWIWYAALVALPIGVLVAAWQGYLFASVVGMEKLASSLGVLLAVAVGRAIALRWLSATSRHIAIEQAERQKAAAGGEVAGAATGTPEENPVPPLPAAPEVDLGEINLQTERIFTSIAYTVFPLTLLAVWSDLLPALDGLRQVVLWTVTRETAAGKVALPVDLLDLLSSLLALALTVIVTRNIPGLVELVVLPRLPLSAGARYAIVTLFRYALGIAGGVIVLKYLGVDWQSVQWLIGAAVLGLSFGLQEIFKNLVSGVILLLEQPIRVGDLVTINGVTGRVTNIRMRATTIVDPDRRDLVVPNSAFITGQVTNWTLADRRTRQVVRVGVAYGSDLRLVERTLLEIANAEPDILKDPAPSVVLADFGDSSVNFDLRVVLEDVAIVAAPMHRIKMAIAEELPRRGVEIPFPQRDLRLRSVDDGVVRVLRGAGR